MNAPYPYVYVNVDGSVRELHASEQRYLETDFRGGDGAMPHVKVVYEERNGWNELSGYLSRSAVPAGTHIEDAPAHDPAPLMNQAEFIAFLEAKSGLKMVKNDDGSFTMKRRQS